MLALICIWQMLWQVGYPVPILVILEHAVVIFVYTIEDHKLKDSLHTTLLAQGQLASLYKTGAIWKKYLFLRCLITVRDKTSELKPTHKYCRLCDSVALCRCLISSHSWSCPCIFPVSEPKIRLGGWTVLESYSLYWEPGYLTPQ
jgi:hypothetical protein